jgi:hypothetical protein
VVVEAAVVAAVVAVGALVVQDPPLGSQEFPVHNHIHHTTMSGLHNQWTPGVVGAHITNV